ncbi:MAG: alpha/beta fold hydrolase [Anaerolineales bacterium]|nr:alpha/beta fold hydrolase [Anaerolineales bacterium]
MSKRLFFPLFNALIGAIFGAAIGYYIFQIGLGVLVGALCGLTIGLGVEFILSRLGQDRWLYQRRVLLLVMLEIPLVIFLLGPFAYVVVEARPNPHPVCCETPLDYGATGYDDVQIQTDDGVIISGWYVPPAGNPGPVIVLLHGARGDRTGTAWHARQLISAGYGVLMYDQRGTGESTGDRAYLGWMQAEDLLKVLDLLETIPEVDTKKIGAVGLSRGAHTALNAAFLEPERMAALWLDGMQAQRIEDFPEAETPGEHFATLINAIILKMDEIYFGQKAPPAFIEILSELSQVEMFIVAGGLAEFESIVNQRYAQAMAANAQLWLIEDAWHVGGAVVAPKEYHQRMVAFFDLTLK